MMELVAEKICRQYFRKSKDRNVFMALKETDISIRAGELSVVYGRSGSGKSTLLNILAGLLSPTSGRVLLDDKDIYSLSDEERSKLRNSFMGIIPQGQTGLRSLTVFENVLLPFNMYGEEPDEERAIMLLQKTGIAELRDVKPNELSGGELRRMAIVRALVKNPAIIMADEPTNDLDDENTKEVLTILKNAADSGAAVLLVTHEKEALSFADTAYRMDAGELKKA